MFGIASLVTAAIYNTSNAFSFLAGQSSRADELREQREYLKQQKQRDLELMDLQFNVAKDEAFTNAGLLDDKTDFAEDTASEDFNLQLENLIAGDTQQLASWNSALMSMGSSTGDALSSTAASGVRSGSSMDAAIDLESAVNSYQLQLSQDTYRQSRDSSLRSIISGLESNIFGMQEQRDEANRVRDSFLEGGNQYNLWQTNRANRAAEYDHAISEVQDAIDEAEDFWGNAFGFITNLHGLGGLNAGSAVSSYISNFVETEYDTKTKFDST